MELIKGLLASFGLAILAILVLFAIAAPIVAWIALFPVLNGFLNVFFISASIPASILTLCAFLYVIREMN